MTTQSTSARLTIFEGPDGSGKSTAAQEYAKQTGAKYVHFGPLPNVKEGLARLYVEAMLPALLGYQDVVFDRCWLSEAPYGMVFRGGIDRLGLASTRMLERLALRCGAVVVKCQPCWTVVRSNYLSRREQEYLENEHQLMQVYETYAAVVTGLPVVNYDYARFGHTESLLCEEIMWKVKCARTPQHLLAVASAGNLSANAAIVGESFGERKNHDPWYQWPFASFSGLGCSEWLAYELEAMQACESELLWVNADQDLSLLSFPPTVVALGTTASQSLTLAGVPHAVCPHPQWWKRFNSKQRYPLASILKGSL